MIRPKLVVVNNERDEQSRSIRDGKGFRFQLSGNRLIVYGLSLVVSLCFMFTLGIFVGRGMSVVRPDDFSLKGGFLRFLGLDRQAGAPVPNASATWEDPGKMLQSLDYYQDLTNANRSPLGRLAQASGKPPVEHPPVAQPVKESPPAVPPKQPPAGQPSAPAPAPLGRYTLLVASLKDRDARPLVDKLKADGYSPFVEPLEFGAAKWSRILLGSFPTRKAAIAFAEQFNRKENTQALVISGSNSVER